MINNPKETEFPPGEEGNSSEIGKVKVSSSAATNPTPWLRLKDPRIVRVSRVFGGKDRHSKVCTIRGLRDRRVRLSVPTAIQLYDLQDRLGLNQPSKVVDWLLNAAKHEIDELPPLPMPLAGGGFSLLTSREANAATSTTASQSNEDQGVSKCNTNDMSATEWELGSPSRLQARPGFWSTSTTTNTTSPDAFWRGRSKEVARETANSTRNNEVEKEEGNEIVSVNLSQRTSSHPFFPGMLNSIAHLPNGAPNYRWEPPNYPLLSHFGGGGHELLTSQTDQHLQSLNVMSLQPSTLSLSTGSPFLICPPGNTSSTNSTTQTYFPSHSSAASVEIVDPRQVNHFQMLSSNLLPNSMRTFSDFGTSNSKLAGYPDQNDNGNDHQQSKEQEE